MAIQIQVTGLTTQQQQDVANAFDEMIDGRLASGMTKAQWVERQLLLFMRSVVKGWKRKQHETTLAGEQAQVDSDYQWEKA